VSSFWRDEGTGGSPDWQGNVALALYERWQRQPNVKFRFGQGYRVRQLGES
jgi:hypothetical protein